MVRHAEEPSLAATDHASGAASPMFDLIELMFFAYRDFVADPDRILESYGFGRAHHRVLHFVCRRPGLTVAALLDTLKITKQSLNRVMKDLLDAGFIDMRSGAPDRRQRRLFVSAAGEGLALELATVQSGRFRRALEAMGTGDMGKGDMGTDAHRHVAGFLLGMVDPDQRDAVNAIVFGHRPGEGRRDD